MAYVGGSQAPAGCIFCEALAAQDDTKLLVLHRSHHAYLILNAYPYVAGHLMAVVNRHVGDLEAAETDELADAMALVKLATSALKAEYRPDGFNVGINIGSAAGAGIRDHLHIHVVPRWSGDANFMAVVGDVRVIPEALDATYQRLRRRLDAPAG